MVDMFPLLVFFLSLAFEVAVILRARRGSGKLRTRPERAGVIGASLVAIVAPYAAFLMLQGDPDVWDFYRSLWPVPALVLGVLASWAIWAVVRSAPR